MENFLHIKEELKQIAPDLIGLNSNIYTVKNDYFETLADTILEKIEATNNNFTSKLPTYSIPNNYFDNLADTVLANVKLNSKSEVELELNEIAPFLISIPKINVYTTPTQYFENLIIEKPTAKIIQFNTFKVILKYASAAIVTGFLAFGGYLFFNKTSIKQSHSLATKTNVEKSFEQLSLDEINKGVKNTEAFYVSTEEQNNVQTQQKIDIEESLQSITDDELQQYINANDQNINTEEIEINTES